MAEAAHAQSAPGTIERTIPKFEPAPKGGQPGVTETTAPAETGARIAQTFILSAVSIEGATIFRPDQLAPIFEPYLATVVGQADLDKIASEITRRYHQSGYLLSYAMVPEQSVQSGIVRIRVIEGYVASIRLAGDRRAATAVRRTFERLTSERPLRAATLERAILIARDMPGATVGDIRIGRLPGDPTRHEVTIAIGVQRYAALAYADNRGTVENARIRGYASASISSLAVPGDQLQLDLFTIPYGHFHYAYGQVKGSVPLNADGLRLTVTASYGDQFQRLTGPDQDGMSRLVGVELSWPLVKRRTRSLTGHFLLTDWKSEQEQGSVLTQRDRIQVARAWIEYERLTPVRLGARLGVSQGLDLGPATERGDAFASRPGAGSSFTKFNANFDLSAPVGRKARFRMEASAQFSTKSLLAPEEFALGGSRIGRAFDFNELTGDHGFGAMAEIAFPLGNFKPALKSIEVFAFLDAGGTFRRHSSPALPKEQWLASVGTGARFTLLGFLWSGEVGAPLAISGADRDVRAYFSVVRQF